eukprot:9300165-Ditylum_brightwellii.AAC.1
MPRPCKYQSALQVHAYAKLGAKECQGAATLVGGYQSTSSPRGEMAQTATTRDGYNRVHYPSPGCTAARASTYWRQMSDGYIPTSRSLHYRPVINTSLM